MPILNSSLNNQKLKEAPNLRCIPIICPYSTNERVSYITKEK